MPAAAAHPVAALRQHATAFEAALTVCLARPKPRAVHDLRSAARRIEAQLLLLDQLPGVPPHRAEKLKLLKHLARLRRAAGLIRDLDIQHRLLATAFPHHAAATRIRARIMLQRKTLAAGLVDLIAHRQRKTSAALEALLDALAPAETTSLPAVQLLRLTNQWFTTRRAASTLGPETEQTLHSIRKAAKLARYLAESAPGPAAKAAATRYERMQKTGGDWHDWLQLSQLPGIQKHAALAASIRRRIAAHLRAFRATLA